MTTFTSINRLRELLEKRGYNSFLFNCPFFDHIITGIYFKPSDTLLISFPHLKVAWQAYLVDGNSLNSYLPKDIYTKLAPLLKVTTNGKPQPIYTAIDNYFGQVREDSVEKVTNAQTKGLLEQTVSTDKAFEDGDKPFFLGWRRNPTSILPSPGNLEKTARTFGKTIKELCLKHRTSSRWTTNATERTFDFLTKVSEQDILNGN